MIAGQLALDQTAAQQGIAHRTADQGDLVSGLIESLAQTGEQAHEGGQRRLGSFHR